MGRGFICRHVSTWQYQNSEGRWKSGANKPSYLCPFAPRTQQLEEELRYSFSIQNLEQSTQKCVARAAWKSVLSCRGWFSLCFASPFLTLLDLACLTWYGNDVSTAADWFVDGVYTARFPVWKYMQMTRRECRQPMTSEQPLNHPVVGQATPTPHRTPLQPRTSAWPLFSTLAQRWPSVAPLSRQLGLNPHVVSAHRVYTRCIYTTAVVHAVTWCCCGAHVFSGYTLTPTHVTAMDQGLQHVLCCCSLASVQQQHVSGLGMLNYCC